MEHRWFFSVLIICLLVVLIFVGVGFLQRDPVNVATPDILVGVDAAYDDVADVKQLVDEVKSYTNFFVIGSTGISFNVTKLDDVCQYVYDSGLNFMIYQHPNDYFSQVQWNVNATQRWGDRFLGLHAYDEAGGRQVDRDEFMLVQHADNYSDAANKFVDRLQGNLTYFTGDGTQGNKVSLFTTDYALYWFDYEAGYDVVLAQFGWNNSRPMNVALARGAASMHDKKWGVIITWTYRNPPYIESGEDLYNDMILAYESGASYVVVFDYPKISKFGILEQEHLDALKRFWDYINHNRRSADSTSNRVAYVLPEDYGYGFRGSDDKIWGLWGADEMTKRICVDINSLLNNYGRKIDIIYEDRVRNDTLSTYSRLVFWNGTIIG